VNEDIKSNFSLVDYRIYKKCGVIQYQSNKWKSYFSNNGWILTDVSDLESKVIKLKESYLLIYIKTRKIYQMI